jgi:hypothetical protein
LLFLALHCLQCKHADAVKELDRRQDSYMRREEQLKLQLAALSQTQDAGDGSNSSSDGSSQQYDPGPNDSNQPATISSRAPKVQVPKPLTLQEMQEQVGLFVTAETEMHAAAPHDSHAIAS